MGNTSKRKPARTAAAAPAPRPPVAPPKFVVIRDDEANTIEILNLDHVVHVLFRVAGDEPILTAWTAADLAIPNPDPSEWHGQAAADILAHLILCGVDVGGASGALAAARGDLYAPYMRGAALVEPGGLGGLPDPDEAAEAPGPCAGCKHQHADRCDGWIPGGLDDDCGAYEAAAADAGARFDEHGGGCACLTPPPPPPALALGELRAGEVSRRVSEFADVPHMRKIAEATRRSCAFGANCKRFPYCLDCSLYALDRACARAHDGDHVEGDDARRVVHVEHVEAVAGETSAQLLKRVERCNVFAGMRARGVVPGDQWCGVGHEMTDPACALCPYLRIYSPAAD